MPQSLDMLIAGLDTLLGDLAHAQAKVHAARNVLAALRGDVDPGTLPRSPTPLMTATRS